MRRGAEVGRADRSVGLAALDVEPLGLSSRGPGLMACMIRFGKGLAHAQGRSQVGWLEVKAIEALSRCH